MSDTKFSTNGEGQRITVKINEYKGNKHVLVQKEFRKYGSEDWHPGKAISVPFDQCADFKHCVDQIIDALVEQHIIAPVK